MRPPRRGLPRYFGRTLPLCGWPTRSCPQNCVLSAAWRRNHRRGWFPASVADASPHAALCALPPLLRGTITTVPGSGKPPTRLWRDGGALWLDHEGLTESDLEWLTPVRRLTAWAVRFPPGLLAQLPNLELLELRGGSGTDLNHVRGCGNLRALVVNQVRGLTDVSAIASLPALQLLSLYGLPRLEQLPSAADQSTLTRAELGSMKGLNGLGPLLEAPNLRELLLIRAIRLIDTDPAAIRDHPTLERFDWFAEDVPIKTWVPVLDTVGKPKATPMLARDWLDSQDTG